MLDLLLSAIYLAVGTALFAAAVVLAVQFHYRINPRIQRNNHWFPPPPINYVLPQQPPPAHFYPPLPRRAPAVDKHPIVDNRGDEENVFGEVEVSVQEGSDGSVTGARLPFIQPSDSSSHHSSAGATPHRTRSPPSAAELARYLIQLGLGAPGPSHPPGTEQPTSHRPRGISVLPATSGPYDIFVSSTSELDLVWDNLNLPYTAFFPPRENPYCWGTAEYPSVIHWDEPVRVVTRSPTPPEQPDESTPESPPRGIPGRLAIPRRRREPTRSIVEIAEELSQFDEDRRQTERRQAEEFRRIDEESQREGVPQVNSRGETVYHTPADSDASTEGPPEEEYVNGIIQGGSPSPSPIPTPTVLNTPPADHPDNHRTGSLPPVDR